MTHVTRFVVAAAEWPALALCVPVQAQTPEIDALRPRAEQGNTQAHWKDARHRGASGKAVFIEDIHGGVSLMKKLIVLFFVVTFGLGSVVTQAQDVELPAGNVVRVSNCTILDNRFSFNDVVERAKALDFGDNAPNMVWFRRPIYASPEYSKQFDFQIGMYYPSYAEMFERRVASGNDSYGRLPISCGTPYVIRSLGAGQPGNGARLADQTALTMSRCSLNEGFSIRDAYGRISAVQARRASRGDNTMMQMLLPGLGGPRDRDFDFGVMRVGATGPDLGEGMDMQRNGSGANNPNGPAFSCQGRSMFGTRRIYQAPAN